MRNLMLRFAFLLTIIVTGATFADAETIDVRFRGAMDLRPFGCQDITRSSFINRVCYDDRNQYMIVQLNGVYYHYCELPKATLNAFLGAPSMGQYFNVSIKGAGKVGPFDCRTHRVPSY